MTPQPSEIVESQPPNDSEYNSGITLGKRKRSKYIAKAW